MKKQKILLLSPHTDDCELGAGGSIAKWIREGREIKYIAFSATEQRALLVKELFDATKVLGIMQENVDVLDYTVREFDKDRQSILDGMIKINKHFNPNLVVIPSTYTTHQDHYVVREEAFRAFKNTSIIGYEDPWNNRTFNTDVFSILKKEDVNKKIEALACYKSQVERKYMKKGFIESLARIRGGTIKQDYAEVFECIRWII